LRELHAGIAGAGQIVGDHNGSAGFVRRKIVEFVDHLHSWGMHHRDAQGASFPNATPKTKTIDDSATIRPMAADR
jgi:hypothetical protein